MHRFIGMFAIVIFDENKNEVFCVRDRVGVKPFFFSLQNQCFSFGSELKALIAHPSFEKRLNLPAVASFIQYGNIPSPGSIYKDTFKLKPGHFLRIDLTKDPKSQLSQTQYWSVYSAYNQPKSAFQLKKQKLKRKKC